MTAPVIDPGLFPLKPLKASNCQKFHVHDLDWCTYTWNFRGRWHLLMNLSGFFSSSLLSSKKQKCQQRNFDYKNLQILKFLDKIVQESINQTKITSVLCVLFYTRYQKMVHLSRGGSTTRFWALESPGPPEDLLNICLLHVHLRRYSR